jgi:hypothetical protein
MLTDELVTQLHELNPAEKLRVVQLLVNDLAGNENILRAGTVYEVWSPYDAAGAAETLEKMLTDQWGRQAFRPLLSLTLVYNAVSVNAIGLLDTGSDVNVLPYNLGLALGAIWEDHTIGLELSGNLANFEARGIILTAHVGLLPPVDLAFAWTLASTAPLILGQTNFFAEFDVCFFRSQGIFEINLKS